MLCALAASGILCGGKGEVLPDVSWGGTYLRLFSYGFPLGKFLYNNARLSLIGNTDGG